MDGQTKCGHITGYMSHTFNKQIPLINTETQLIGMTEAKAINNALSKLTSFHTKYWGQVFSKYIHTCISCNFNSYCI